jgi:hypothetical protein
MLPQLPWEWADYTLICQSALPKRGLPSYAIERYRDIREVPILLYESRVRAQNRTLRLGTTCSAMSTRVSPVAALPMFDRIYAFQVIQP